MNFLASWWLFGLGTLLLPVLLHLWKQPKIARLKIGSLRFIPTISRLPVRSWNVRDLLLLLLRLLILSLLFGWLARPVFQPRIAQVSGKWLLIDARLRPIPRHSPAAVLLRNGYEPRVENFEDLWSVLAEADRTLSADSSLAVLTSSRLADLRGQRPALRHKVQWLAGDAPAEQKWTARIQPRGVAIGRTSASATSYQWQERAEAGVPTSIGLPAIVLVADPGQEQETANLTAALRTALAVGGGAATIRDGTPTAANEGDLLIWLSEQTEIPAATKAHVIIKTARSSELQAVNTFLQTPDRPAIRLLGRQPLPGQPLWRISNGLPLMTLENVGTQRIYHFQSRFLISAGDLVESGFLVSWLIEDILPAVPGVFANVTISAHEDLRTVSLDEVRGRAVSASEIFPPLPAQLRNLQPIIWWLLVAAFLAERIVSLTLKEKRR